MHMFMPSKLISTTGNPLSSILKLAVKYVIYLKQNKRIWKLNDYLSLTYKYDSEISARKETENFFNYQSSRTFLVLNYNEVKMH